MIQSSFLIFSHDLFPIQNSYAFFLHQFHQQQLSKRSRNKINKVIVTQLNPLLFIMKQTSSHTSHFKYSRKEKDRLQVIKRSDSPAKIDTITNIKQQEEQFLPRDIEYQLQLNIQKYSYEVKDQIRYLLMELLRYPSIKMAIRHSYANRLGYHDLKHIKNKYNEQSTYLSSRYRPDHCEDCNLILQQRQVPICSSIWQYPKAGLATYLLFRNMKVIMMMLFFLGALFTIVSLYINIKVIQILVSTGTSITLTLDFSSFGILISNGLKVTYSSSSSTISLLFYLQAILLILVLLVWWFSKYVVECVSQKYARIVDQASLTAADFSIMLENVPIHYSKQSLQAQFDRYFESLLFGHNIKNTWGEVIHPFTIRKICQTIPFSLNQSDVLDKQLQGLDHDIFQKKKLFAQWVQQIKVNSRFTFTRTQRQRQYLIFEKMLERRQAKLEEMEQRAQQQYKRANKNMTSTVFVTFYHNQSAEIIENLNPQNLPAKIRYYLSCKKSTQYFDIRDFKVNNQADIVASRAPQPEDIIWGNVAVPLKVLFVRKLLVWLAMMVLSGICLAIVIGLSFAQIGGNTFWPAILIGLFITIFNILTKFVLRKISPYEKDITQTERQRGILLKSLFVMAFNWIVPLVATNIGTQKNFYSTNGYAQQVFWIGLFEAIIPPIIRIFDPEHLVKIILKCWKARPYNKIILKQSELNSYLQRQQYELGYSYIYFFNILFLNAFYVNMQPAIVIAALIGTFMMYWAQKYCLINRSHRPEKSAKTLNETVQTLLSFTPFILWMGHIIWVNAMLKDYSSSIFSVDMALMCLSIGYFITPWKSLYACFCHIPQQENLDFQTCRSKLPTEYDRLNPATVQEGVADYIQHLQDKKKEESNLLNRSEENLLQNFNTNLLMQQISKIPAIFGRKNQVTKKIDKSAINRPKSIKGQEIELLLVQPQNNQSLNESYISVAQSNTKNKLASRQQSPQLVQKSNQSQVFQKDNNSNEKSKPRYAQSETQSPENDKKEVMNLNSNGQTFGRKKGGLNQKRKTISVVYKQENYQYQNRSSKL